MSGGTYTGKGEKDGPMQIDNETLMALADGELDPARAEALRRAVAADPELQARLHRFQETRRLLAGLRQTDAAEDPLAAVIRAAVRPDAGVASSAPVPPPASGARLGGQTRDVQPPANLNRRPWMAAAASVAIVALGLGWWQWAGAPGPQSFSAAELAALDSLPSGQVQPLDQGAELAMIASFRAGDGGLCREYETRRGEVLRTVLACRGDAGWSERFAAESRDGGQEYRPASGEGTIDNAIAAIGAEAPLTPEDEAAALRE
ncbi:hypothetical protein FOB51_10940 [Paracoccus yeei]|uniref:Anti-sigma factor n=2 Tax=Paracoccus yeei TaxID=147645 RepID=A0A5P2QQZ9_9RHOB|nr:hypothetical protein FOB51_10940 [Paracoccus yeei]